MLNGDNGTGQVHTRVGLLFDAQTAIGIVEVGDFRNLIIYHCHILRGFLADQVMIGGFPLNDGVIAGFQQGNIDLAVAVSDKGANAVTIGADNLKPCAGKRQLRPGFVFQNPQSSFIGFIVRVISVIAVCGQVHGNGRVGVYYIVLQVAIGVLLLAYGIEHSVLVDICTEGELDAASLTLDAVCRVEHLELTGVPIASPFGCNGGNILVVKVNNTGSFGNRGGVGETHIDCIIANPGLAPEGKYLLLVLLAVYGDGVCGITIRGAGDTGRKCLSPAGAPGVNVLCCRKNFLRPGQLNSRQGGINFQVIDVPVGEQIAPERHFCGIVRLVLVLQVQLRKATGRIAVCNNTHHLGIAGLFFGQIGNAFPNPNGLRNSI